MDQPITARLANARAAGPSQTNNLCSRPNANMAALIHAMPGGLFSQVSAYIRPPSSTR